MRMARTVAVAVSSATPGSVSVSSADPSYGPGPAAASVWGTAGSCAGRAPVQCTVLHCTVLYCMYCIVLYLATERGRGYGPHLLVPGRLLRQYQHCWCPLWFGHRVLGQGLSSNIFIDMRLVLRVLKSESTRTLTCMSSCCCWSRRMLRARADLWLGRFLIKNTAKHYD